MHSHENLSGAGYTHTWQNALGQGRNTPELDFQLIQIELLENTS